VRGREVEPEFEKNSSNRALIRRAIWLGIGFKRATKGETEKLRG